MKTYNTLGTGGSTGTGLEVLQTSPTIITPIINSAAHVGGTWVADATWTLPALTLGGTVTATGVEITAPTLNNAVGKGTWTASGTWTLPAMTLGGTVSGGGQQLNNIIIGTSTPLAGFFTTLSSTGTTALGNGAGDTVTITVGSSNPVLIDRLSDANNYAGISFNGVVSTGMVGIWSRGTTDDLLVFQGGATNGAAIKAGGTTIATFTTAGYTQSSGAFSLSGASNTVNSDAAAVATNSVNINVGGTTYKFLVKT